MIAHFLKPELLEGLNQNLMHQHLAANTLSVYIHVGSNRYHCPDCNSLQDAEKSCSISTSSEHLMLTLKRYPAEIFLCELRLVSILTLLLGIMKRFAYDPKTNSRTKILQTAQYPLLLRVPVLTEKEETKEGGDAMDIEASQVSASILIFPLLLLQTISLIYLKRNSFDSTRGPQKTLSTAYMESLCTAAHLHTMATTTVMHEALSWLPALLLVISLADSILP